MQEFPQQQHLSAKGSHSVVSPIPKAVCLLAQRPGLHWKQQPKVSAQNSIRTASSRIVNGRAMLIKTKKNGKKMIHQGVGSIYIQKCNHVRTAEYM